ncbi:glucose-1-phosphate thymidylyltransferase [Candidatus Endolissoclinum faulkneri L5]|uniref:Glucose-1-phosphate thymidylyltransferase n=1 Tax=Candidatus Endolissoclinum faulkneri L5 TaxID=1401328 RepID=V9TU93_9PROT|nr:glucose-1-phosphate thymidylyltransferase RfbA [Candidatus Endolissoclinum faulkneri]AHC73712.1 glucose-1-phosphate thymidylyltransferase [Candidatus Endolissoclinum faulkneri L5]
MKGIILAGGSGTRLYPLTLAASKQILPVYDKPMIYYPLTTLMLAGIREIMLISRPQNQKTFQNLIGDGTKWGIEITYATQSKQKGLAEAFIIGREFVSNDPVALVLGDNIFYGHSLTATLQCAREEAVTNPGATIFTYYVNDPRDYGVVDFDANGQAKSLVEKPTSPMSNWVVTGLYFYDNNVLDIASIIKPSPRGELEITDLNKVYLSNGTLRVKQMGRGYAWLDTGTHSSLLQASEFVRTIEERQGLKIACVEEIAYRMGYIDIEQVLRLAAPLAQSGYGKYLQEIVSTEQFSG